MEQRILVSTKKILGLDEAYTAFDHDIIVHINSAFSTLNQLGVGPEEGFMIYDDTTTWNSYPVPIEQLNMVRTYVFLSVRMLFDPPATSFHLEAMNRQKTELEWRLNVFTESHVHVDGDGDGEFVLDGGAP